MYVLILGAGLMQKPAIMAAKSLGYKAAVIDADNKAVCVPLADEFRNIDLKAKEQILEYAQELKQKKGLKAVFTAGTDFSASVSFVCQKLGLPSHSYVAAENASIKTMMRRCFQKKNVPSPDFTNFSKKEISEFEENPEGIKHKLSSMMNFPLVVKPVDNMGARGCRMVRSFDEFVPALKVAAECSKSGNVIVEEYMEGPEFSIDSIVYDGTMTITGFAERHIAYPPYFIETGHTMPAVLTPKMHDELISVFALGVKALGLTCGAAKADIKYTSKGPMIGEIAGRLSGGYMSGWTYPYASSLNLTKQTLLVACGENPSELEKLRKPVTFNPGELCSGMPEPFKLYEVPCNASSAERAWISIPGKIKYIENINDYTDKAVTDVFPRPAAGIGCPVDFPRNNVSKCGNVITRSIDRKIAVSAAEDAVSNIFITLEPCNEETEKFLSFHYEKDEDKFPPSAFEKIDFSLCDKLEGLIPADEKTEKYIPAFLKTDEVKDLIDWNYNTVLQTARKFDILRPNHPQLNLQDFWKAVLRGGIQAAVYFSDSSNVC